MNWKLVVAVAGIILGAFTVGCAVFALKGGDIQTLGELAGFGIVAASAAHLLP